MPFPTTLTSIHKWVGVAIGIQVVLWIAGGLVMSAFPIELVRGETQAAAPEPVPIGVDELGIDLRASLAANAEITALRTVRVADRLFVEAQRGTSPALLFDARDGTLFPAIDEALARDVARRDFTGDGRIIAATLVNDRLSEYRGALPVWQVRFDDARDTAIYVSPANGQVVARRNDIWRLYDFFLDAAHHGLPRARRLQSRAADWRLGHCTPARDDRILAALLSRAPEATGQARIKVIRSPGIQ